MHRLIRRGAAQQQKAQQPHCRGELETALAQDQHNNREQGEGGAALPEKDQGGVGKPGKPREKSSGKGWIGKRQVAYVSVIVEIRALGHLSAGEPINLQIQGNAPHKGAIAVEDTEAVDDDADKSGEHSHHSGKPIKLFHGEKRLLLAAQRLRGGSVVAGHGFLGAVQTLTACDTRGALRGYRASEHGKQYQQNEHS